ncbi:uncharacterized protein LOC130719245 [Lotus japonicus]|uniref:uncharacterized protein LOC130719245 n=1 Tax=Lotus japonicus TaxID=34305 RepID=UPI0025853950|nr:uncharacterized protein LOC130719245 [Lotus japonicus]
MHWASEVKTKKKGKKIRAGLERRGEASFREVAKLGFQVGGSNQGRNLLEEEPKEAEEDEEEDGREKSERSQSRSQRRHVFEDIDIDQVEDGKKYEEFGGEEEEKGRVSICIPPKNALLLMRCKSGLWESPLKKDKEKEEDSEEEQEEEEGEKDQRIEEMEEDEEQEKNEVQLESKTEEMLSE